jgi:hypothetical protein
MQKATSNKAIQTGRDIQPEISDLALDILFSKLNDLHSYRKKRMIVLRKEGQIDTPLEKIWQRYDNWTCSNKPSASGANDNIKQQYFENRNEVTVLPELGKGQNINSFISEISTLKAKGKSLVLSDIHCYQEASWWSELFDVMSKANQGSHFFDNIGLLINHPFTVLELDEILFELKGYLTKLYFDPIKYVENTKHLLSKSDISDNYIDLIRKRLSDHAELRRVELFVKTKTGGYDRVRKGQNPVLNTLNLEDIALTSEEVFLVHNQF